jgi:heptosyltransferase-3
MSKIIDPKRILISRTDSIGDVILTLPLCSALKKAFPQAKILFLAAAYTVPIVEQCEDVDHIYDWSSVKDCGLQTKLAFFEDMDADVIVHVFPRPELAKLAKLAGIPHRIGTSHRTYHLLSCNHRVNFSRKNSDLHEAQLNFCLLKPLGVKSDPTWEETQELLSFKAPKTEYLSKFKAKKTKRVLLHSKSQGSAIEWPMTKYRELAHKCEENGWEVCFTGTHGEGEEIRKEIQFNSQVLDTTGLFSLEELIGFIEEADVLVACSTGPLHIAAGLNTPAIGLYTPRRPMHPGRWRPMGKNSEVITSKPGCSCKDKESCTCLVEIEVDDGFAKIQALLS